MDAPESRLEARARRAYETGRLGWAARRGVLLAPLVGVSFLCCGRPVPTLACGVLLVLVVVFCLWRGQEHGRGVAPGLLAGGIPLALPILTRASGHLCAAGGCLLFPSMCAIGGLLGGVALGLLAPRPRDGQAIPFVTACVVAGLAGALGCLLYGLVGLGVMIAGLLAGAAPALVLRRG
jgi:hypothetical protein